MTILGAVRKLFLPATQLLPAAVIASTATPSAISRRTFFSFLGAGGVLLAKPDLFVPRSATEKIYGMYAQPVAVHLGWDDQNIQFVWFLGDSTRRMILAEASR